MIPVLQGILGLRRHWRRYMPAFIGQDRRRRWISGVQTALWEVTYKEQSTVAAQVGRTTLAKIAMHGHIYIIGPLPVTPRGNRYILVVGDYFTKWTP